MDTTCLFHMLASRRKVSSVNKKGPLLCGEKGSTSQGAEGRRHCLVLQKTVSDLGAEALPRRGRTAVSWAVTGVLCSDVPEGRGTRRALGLLSVPNCSDLSQVCPGSSVI